MIKSKVRCWQIAVWRKERAFPDMLYISYPEDNFGYHLLTCLRCGHIFSASVAKMVYVGPPLDEKLRGLACINCGCDLAYNYASYPENYIADGAVATSVRPIEIPPSSESVIKEFDEIYG